MEQEVPANKQRERYIRTIHSAKFHFIVSKVPHYLKRLKLMDETKVP